MTANIEREIGELRSDVRHVLAAIERREARDDRISSKLDEINDKLGNHTGDDAKQFAVIHERFKVAAEEKRESRAAFWVRYAVTAAVGALAGLGGGNVKLPGIH
jgi:septal ring factor EnvC (AmiA/AmiB activator)